MKHLIGLLLLLTTLISRAQVEVIQFRTLQKKLATSDNDLTIVNFWATWCGPCIKEIPYFEATDKADNIKVYLVSVDFRNQLDKVNAFVEKRNLEAEVLFLNEKDPDDYMHKISPDWSGAIPATLFVNKMGKTFFHEKSFTKEELESLIVKYL